LSIARTIRADARRATATRSSSRATRAGGSALSSPSWRGSPTSIGGRGPSVHWTFICIRACGGTGTVAKRRPDYEGSLVNCPGGGGRRRKRLGDYEHGL
jgi:hypothetical protein